MDHWRERSRGDVTDWPAFEACLLGDRAAFRQAWTASDDALSMLLALCGLHPVDEDERTEALTRALSFCPPFARLADAQTRAPPGSNYNGLALFRFARLLDAARRAPRTAPEPERSALDARLSAAIRSLIPDPCALEDDGEPGLATSGDKDRDRPAFGCGAEVGLRSDAAAGGRVCRVAWNTRFRCWTYWLAGDRRRWKAEDLR